jgi:L-ascorbate metabolism protein UlaG (beta-lactamase superfamily)
MPVLISHVHRDHLDLPTLRRLSPALTVVPRGAGGLIDTGGEVHEPGVGEEIMVGSTTIRAVPAMHHAGRGRVRPSAIGYVVDEDLYFAGDTDVFSAMDRIGPLRLALLPVWGWGCPSAPGTWTPPGRRRPSGSCAPASRCRSTGAPTSRCTGGGAGTRG